MRILNVYQGVLYTHNGHFIRYTYLVATFIGRFLRDLNSEICGTVVLGFKHCTGMVSNTHCGQNCRCTDKTIIQYRSYFHSGFGWQFSSQLSSLINVFIKAIINSILFILYIIYFVLFCHYCSPVSLVAIPYTVLHHCHC